MGRVDWFSTAFFVNSHQINQSTPSPEKKTSSRSRNDVTCRETKEKIVNLLKKVGFEQQRFIRKLFNQLHELRDKIKQKKNVSLRVEYLTYAYRNPKISIVLFLGCVLLTPRVIKLKP